MDGLQQPPTGPDAWWAQVVARDRAADGVFYYSVSTTGVFCRPSCPSRQANRHHVAFHDSIAACKRAGFRPCRRCRPDQPPLRDRHAAVVARACRLIEQAEEPPDLAALAASAGLGRHHFHRIFHAIAGITPRDYASAHRAARLRAVLPGSRTVTEAVYAAGFASSSRFYDGADALLGMTPSRYRAGGLGATIRFAIGDCSLGAILVACTEAGVCAILLGDAPDQLARDLQDRFPAASLIGADGAFESLVAQVVGLVDTPRDAVAALPLDIGGTVFQQRVWAALRLIPMGETISYAGLAARLGMPGSSRAVAGACAANPIAVAIPCHRVVRTDGGLSGYRWGVERKRALLERERAGSDQGRCLWTPPKAKPSESDS